MKDRYQIRLCNLLLAVIAAVFMAAGCGQKEAGDLKEMELGKAKQHSAETKKEETVKGQTAVGKTKQEKTEQEKESGRKVFVYVCGAVKAPGVYELAGDARVYEAISSAGGTRDDAAAEALNQARVVTDGERIYIPTLEEAQKGIVDGNAPGVTETDGNNKGKLNINTADKEELKTLPGIGDAKAESIISYRESNGHFKSVEELKNVEGIKEGVFNKIKGSIIVTS